MALELTLDAAEWAYEYMRWSTPFFRSNLPPADEVQFLISGARDRYGHHRTPLNAEGHHEMLLSAALIGSTAKLMEIVGHEQIHLLQAVKRTDTRGVEHNAEFRKLALRLCQLHVFDPKAFV